MNDNVLSTIDKNKTRKKKNAKTECHFVYGQMHAASPSSSIPKRILTQNTNKTQRTKPSYEANV